MKALKYFFSAAVISCAGIDSNAADAAPLGSPKFQPSVAQPMGWRGDGTGHFPGATPPLKWSRTIANGKPESSGILFMTPIPAGGSAPIIVGDRVYFGFDPYGLMCVSKTDGRILWYRTHHYYDVMAEQDRKKAEDKAREPAAKMKELYDAELKRMSAAVSTAGVAEDQRFMNWAWGQKLAAQQKLLDAAVKEVDPEHYRADKNYWEFATATPISDGKYVFMWYSNRVAVCYDLDGNRQWVTIEPFKEKKFGEHGRHSSPVLTADRFIVLYANDVIAFERKTGKPLWTMSLAKAVPWAPAAYSSLTPTLAGGEPYVVTPRGEGFRDSDGELGWGPFKDYGGENTSAIVDKGRIFIWDRAGMIQLHIPNSPGPSATAIVGKSIRGKEYMIASPICIEGLVYYVTDKGLLHVFDPDSGSIVYETQLPLKQHIEYVFFPGYAASPTLAGKYLYILDNQGGTVILEPGLKYKEVGTNKIDTPEKKIKDKDGKETIVFEQTVSSPVFEGKSMFVRGQQYLYCIGSR